MNPVLGFTSCFSNIESIPMLNGSNFSEWKEHLLLVLALMDLDVSLRQERPDPFKQNIGIERWDRSNRISMMIMTNRIPSKFRGIVPEDVTTAKEVLAAFEKCFAKPKANINLVTDELLRMKEENESVREYIMMKIGTAPKLKKLGWNIPDDLVAKMSLDKLPPEYDLLKRTYRNLEEKWSTHDLISHCVQEEERLMWEKKERDLIAVKVICDMKRNLIN